MWVGEYVRLQRLRRRPVFRARRSGLAWSRRRFGTWLPGAVSLFTLGTYYFGLDFSQVAQRDWHAAAFAALAMIAIEAAPVPWGYVLSILSLALGFTIRPQVVMFLPGLLWALHPAGIRTADLARWSIPWPHLRLAAYWMFGFAMLTGMLFLPLIRQGLLDDLARGITTVLPGSGYSTAKFSHLVLTVRLTLAHGRVWGLLMALALLWPSTSESTRKSVIGWLLLLGGAVAYLAITPVIRPYVLHTFWLIWAFPLGILALMILEATGPSWRFRALAMTLVLMVMNVGNIPGSCNPALFVPAVKAWRAAAPRKSLHGDIDICTDKA